MIEIASTRRYGIGWSSIHDAGMSACAASANSEEKASVTTVSVPMGGGYGRREVCALPVGSVCGVSVPSSRRYAGTDTPQPRQQSHEAVRDLVQRPTSVPLPSHSAGFQQRVVRYSTTSVNSPAASGSRNSRRSFSIFSARLSTSARTDSMSQSKSWACLRASVPRS